MSFNPTLSVPRRTALFGLLSVAGCGFAPVYGSQGSAGVLRNAVAVTTSETVAGFALRNRLIDRLGPVQTPRYTLAVTVSTNQTAAAISGAGDTTRINLKGVTNWILSDANGAVLLTGTSQTFSSYSATGSTVATQSAATDAQARLTTALADMIVADLLAQAAGLPQ